MDKIQNKLHSCFRCKTAKIDRNEIMQNRLVNWMILDVLGIMYVMV